MDKTKKIKIFIGIFYLVLVTSFLIFLLTKFNLEELSSYKFIQSNIVEIQKIKETNFVLICILFFLATIFFVLMLGFGSPVALLGGFIFGKWLGTIIVAAGLSMGAMFLYIFANYFLKDLIKIKFLNKYKNLEEKFKKNEFSFFLLYRFVGGIPFQIANILPVLFNVSIKNYLLGTFIGIIPALFIMVSLGSGIEKIILNNQTAPSLMEMIYSPEIYIPVACFFCLLLITIIVKKIFYKN